MLSKNDVLTLCVRSAGDQLPIIANASAIRLEDALALARQAQETGVQGLMFTPRPISDRRRKPSINS
jgi:dihydrodipicolinate synthase/N-acetylneuraminate lyase